MAINKTGDTRDLVIELATRFEDLEARVQKNSVILDRLDDYVTQARGASRLAKVLWDGGRLILAGASGAGLWPYIHGVLPKL